MLGNSEFVVITAHTEEVINDILAKATGEELEALIAFGSKMYHDGWTEWGPWFLALGLSIGAALGAGVTIAVKKLKEARQTE